MVLLQTLPVQTVPILGLPPPWAGDRLPAPTLLPWDQEEREGGGTSFYLEGQHAKGVGSRPSSLFLIPLSLSVSMGCLAQRKGVCCWCKGMQLGDFTVWLEASSKASATASVAML